MEHGAWCTTVATLCLQVVVLVQGLSVNEESPQMCGPREGREGRRAGEQRKMADVTPGRTNLI